MPIGNANATHSPVEFVLGAAAVKPPFVCDPGKCVSYSSTNYVLLGLVLLALQPTGGSMQTPVIGPMPAHGGSPAWWDMTELRSILPKDPERNLSFPRSTFLSRGPISEATTIFGRWVPQSMSGHPMLCYING